MQDEFDNGMGIPDDELAGESGTSDSDALNGDEGVDLEAPESEPVGRASGGARAMSSGGAKAATPRKAAPAKKAVTKKSARAAKRVKPARKSAAPAKKSARKAAGKASRKS